MIQKIILTYNKSQLNKNNRRKIYFFFVDKRSINAFATNIENIDVIGINIGVLTVLYDYYSKIIDESLFPEIRSNKEERLDLLFNLQVMSFLYIIFHEMGHLYNGHIDMDNKSFRKEIKELNREERKQILHNKALELDADAFAMNRMIEFTENLITVKNNKSTNRYLSS